ncbi:MAG: hypothetical protein QGG67_16520 [Gammaproteobacteria bacterium]|nr:hypothetical protein [Gammaproteobacteria bacterium]
MLAGVSLLLVYGIRDIEEATNHDEGYTLDAKTVGWSQRFAQWQAEFEQYADYPVTGSGLGTCNALYPAYRSLGDRYTAGNYVHKLQYDDYQHYRLSLYRKILHLASERKDREMLVGLLEIIDR